MNKLDPKVAVALTIVVVVLAGIVVFKSTIGNHAGDAPPIAGGGPTAKMTLPTGNGGGSGAPPIAGSLGGTPGGAPPLGGNMTLPGAPPH